MENGTSGFKVYNAKDAKAQKMIKFEAKVDKNQKIAQQERVLKIQANVLARLQALDERMRYVEDKVVETQKLERKGFVEEMEIFLKSNNHIPTTAELLNVYLWGSRFYGTNHKDTDWDMVVILKGFEQPKEKNVVTWKENIDLSLWAVESFQEKISVAVPWVIQFLYFPPEARLLDCHSFQFRLKLSQLKRAVNLNLSINLRQAKSFWREGEIRKSKKRIFYVIQILDLMTQLAKFDKIVNFSQANVHYKPLMSGYFPAWEDLEKFYLPIYDKLLEEFKLLTHFHQTFEAQVALTNSSNSNLFTPIFTLEFLKDYKPERLEHYFAIRVSHHDLHPNLVHLVFSKDDSPFDSKLVRECSPLIFDTEKKVVVATSHPRFFLNTADALQYFQIDPKQWPINQSKIYRKKDGYLVILYNYQNQWLVSSLSSANASEKAPKSNRKLYEIFWETWKGLCYSNPCHEDQCYVFEVLHHELRKIISYPKNDIILHGAYRVDPATNVITNIEPKIIGSDQKDWHVVEDLNGNHSFKNLQEVISYCSKLSDDEGVVIVHPNGERVAVRSSLYEAIRNISTIPDLQIQEENMIDVLADFPFVDCPTLSSWPFETSKPLFDTMLAEFSKLCEMLDAYYPTIQSLGKEETFQKVHQFMGKHGNIGKFLFFMKDSNHVNARSFFANDQDRRKVHKYLQGWWSEFHKSEPSVVKFMYK